MKKILTINCTGNEGSTYKIIDAIEQGSNAYEYYHVFQFAGETDDRHYRVTPWRVTQFYYYWARIKGLKYGVGNIPTKKLLRYIESVKPDLVHVHCPNFYTINLYKLFDYLKKSDIPVLITNHAEFFYTGNCAHAMDCQGYLTGCKNCQRVFDEKHKYLQNKTAVEWEKMYEAFHNACNFTMTVVSPWAEERIKTSPVVDEKIPVYVVENGVDTDIFKKKNEPEGLDVKSQGRKMILNVTSGFNNTPLDPKGGRYFIELAKKMPEIDFVVAGPCFIEDKSALPDNLKILGNITDQNQLADLYNVADLTVLTSKRETFGLACAESMCCGTPVVGFLAGGTESIALEEYSQFVEFSDVDALQQAIVDWMNKKSDVTDELENAARARYSKDVMVKGYLDLYDKLLNQ